jgi:hypothetical protein
MQGLPQTLSFLQKAHPPLIPQAQKHYDGQQRAKAACGAGHSIFEREQLAAAAQTPHERSNVQSNADSTIRTCVCGCTYLQQESLARLYENITTKIASLIASTS